MSNSKKQGGYRGKSFARTIAFQIIHEHEANPEIPDSLDEEFIQEKFDELASGRAADPDEDGDLIFSPEELPLGDLSDKRINGWMAFARELITATLSNREEIDRKLAAASENWSLQRMMTTDRNILRMAVAELDLGTPVPVVINEAIELGKKFGAGESASFINGILSGILRKKEEISDCGQRDADSES